MIKPFSKQHILDASKLKEFVDDNFKLIENGRKLSKQVENTVGKGEIARYEQFLLFPRCFQKTCTADTSGLVWERVKVFIDIFFFFQLCVPKKHLEPLFEFNCLPHKFDF